jgi:hypothetical protein
MQAVYQHQKFSLPESEKDAAIRMLEAIAGL